MKPIWIVDDDQSIRFVLEKALAREQFATRSFSNPRDVLAALDDDEPQVLVSDIRMPGGSGIDLLGKVKARLPGLPVIIMTAYSDLDSAVSAFQGGAFEYLPKPFDLTRAVELIRRAVEESLREDVRDLGNAVQQSKRALPVKYLDTHLERVLLEQRRYQKRTVFGGPSLRTLLVPARESIALPAYLPEAVAEKLPLVTQMKVKVIAYANPSQDQYESHPHALRIVALGRVMAVDTWRR